jgi:alpha-tubulin suppressor-like RCC1 family protein
VICWGLDIGTPPKGQFTQIAMVDGRACALQEDGKVACWGSNINHLAPPDEKFVFVSVGNAYSCGLRENGSAVCWGKGNSISKPPQIPFLTPAGK